MRINTYTVKRLIYRKRTKRYQITITFDDDYVPFSDGHYVVGCINKINEALIGRKMNTTIGYIVLKDSPKGDFTFLGDITDSRKASK